MSFLNRLRGLLSQDEVLAFEELLDETEQTLAMQTELLQEAARQIDTWQALALTSQRSARDLAIAFRVAQETPEVDLRDDLDELITKLSDQVAKLEEHMV